MAKEITNKHNLPEEVYKALCSNRYVGDDDGKRTDYSATSLISPVQQTLLKRRYPDVSGEDALDRVWSMFGSIAHTLLEEHGCDDSLTEKRFYTEVLGKSISGQVDHYKDGTITDYKTTSAFKVTKRSYDDWEKQLNVYAWLAEINGLPVRNIRIIAIIRDWNQRDADKQPDYPRTPIVVIPITLWSPEETEKYVTSRVELLEYNNSLIDSELVPCTDEEMWASPDVYAVMKEGRKSAVRLFDNKEDAENELIVQRSASDVGVFYLVERKGERRRCAKYCAASLVCSQYKKFLEENTELSE